MVFPDYRRFTAQADRAQAHGRWYYRRVEVLKATVRNGRLTLDAPTELPEGAVVELRVVDDDGMSDADRRELHDSIARGIRDGRAGRVADFDEVLGELDAEP